MESFIKNTKIPFRKLYNFYPNDEYLLGKGASGSVYRYTENNVTLAVKMIDSSGMDEGDFYEDILWQTIIMDSLKGLNGIVPFHSYDIYKNDYSTFVLFIMDFLPNSRDLYEYINEDHFWSRNLMDDLKKEDNISLSYTLPYSKKVSIAVSLIQSLYEIHERGVIHADIKTGNIIINEEKVKLIDFGASIFTGEDDILTYTDWKHGTLGYRAPEEEYHNLLGKPSDIYSLGVTLIELWSGSIWIDACDFKKTRNEVLRSLRMIEKKDIIIGNILRKCIDLNSKRRPKINKILTLLKSLKKNYH